MKKTYAYINYQEIGLLGTLRASSASKVCMQCTANRVNLHYIPTNCNQYKSQRLQMGVLRRPSGSFGKKKFSIKVQNFVS